MNETPPWCGAHPTTLVKRATKNGHRMKEFSSSLGGRNYCFYCFDDSLIAQPETTSKILNCGASKAAIICQGNLLSYSGVLVAEVSPEGY